MDSRPLLSQGKTEFFNHGVGQHFTGDSLDFRRRLFAREPAVECQLKILSLANALQSLVSHLLECALDGFALWVENALLERNVNVGCHKEPNYT